LAEASESAASWGQDSGGTNTVQRPTRAVLAAGGYVPFGNAKPTQVGGGFKTGTPRAIVGEGSRHPEYVIPTDPKYRDRAMGLVRSLLGDMGGGKRGAHTPRLARDAQDGRSPERYGIGGIIGGIKDTFTDAAGNVMDWAGAPFDALYAKFKELGRKVLEEVWPALRTDAGSLESMPAAMVNKMRRSVLDMLTNKGIEKGDSELGAGIYGAYNGPLNSVTGLHPVFKERFDRYSNAVGGLSITSGWRSMERQAQLYQDYLNGVPGQAPAAPPGKSNHEYGLAIDHAPHSNQSMRDTAKTFLLRYPMSYEDWHVEPNEARQWRDAGMAPTLGYGNIINANGGTPGTNQSIGRQMAFARGWGGANWDRLNRLWQRESGWNHLADNPTSSAYGIPQALPGSKMASHGPDWLTNPRTQIAWGLDYIAGRYGDPMRAWAHSEQTGWYGKGGRLPFDMGRIPALANGGIVTGETWARMGEYGRNEAVVPLDSARGRSILGGGVTIHEGAVKVEVQGNVVEDVMPEVEKAIQAAIAELARLISVELEA
jgi:hypothetical protein